MHCLETIPYSLLVIGYVLADIVSLAFPIVTHTDTLAEHVVAKTSGDGTFLILKREKENTFLKMLLASIYTHLCAPMAGRFTLSAPTLSKYPFHFPTRYILTRS